MNQETSSSQTTANVAPRPAATGTNARRRLIIASILILIVAAGVIYWLMGRGLQSTDDAQIEGNLVPVNARVSGYVSRVYVDDNQKVNVGVTLVQLDQRDLLAKLRSAEANLATLKAQGGAASAQLALTTTTAPASAQAAGAQAAAAGSGVAGARTQISAAKSQAIAAQSNAGAARDAISAAESDITAATAQIDSAKAGLQVAQANVSSAQAQADKTASDAARYRQLFNQGAASKQQYESAQAANTSAQAALQAAREQVGAANAAVAQARSRRLSAQSAEKQAVSRARAADASATQARAAIQAAEAVLATSQSQLAAATAVASGAKTVPQQIAIGQSQNRAATARIQQATADVRNARLQLAYTTIAAPVAGVVGQKSIQPGQYVQPGQTLMAVVPLHDVWVIANYKETQLTDMRPGQPADVTVDAYPGRSFRGKVQSIGPASGAQFSLLPPENATGNFVKVVQRIPVKIVFDKGLPEGVVLRPGMNVTATVDTRGNRG